MRLYDYLYEHRFTIFTVSLLAVLFGSLFIPPILFESVLGPSFFVANLLAGILLISKKIGRRRIFIGLLAITILTYVLSYFFRQEKEGFTYVRFGMLFLFYSMVTVEIIAQVWRSNKVNSTVILGLISGYICLGLIGFFIFTSIELVDPGSFSGISQGAIRSDGNMEGLLYFSYITLLTIGYGDILPLSKIARNASMLVGLIGQFYLVILTAIVVGKFLNQINSSKKED